VPRRGLERDAAQNGSVGIVCEVDILESDRAGAHFQSLGAGKVFDFGVLRQDGEHRLDVDDRLFDVPVHHPHEIERLVELQHDQVDEHKCADSLGSASDLGDAHQKDHNQANGENERLTGVENRERYIGAHAHMLVPRHGLVVAPRLAAFRAKVFHRLEVEQAVDRLGVGVGVALVHRTPDADAPIGG
jgi:hypothetical protein